MTAEGLPFRIDFDWHARDEPLRFDPDDFGDWPRLFVELRRFLALYEGFFTVDIGQHRLTLDFDPDLSTVFLELPGMLRSIAADEFANARIDFFEQRTSAALELRRLGAMLEMRVTKGPDVSPDLIELPDGPLLVRTSEFLRAWVRFLHAVLDALEAQARELPRPSEAFIEDLAAYRGDLAHVARVATT